MLKKEYFFGTAFIWIMIISLSIIAIAAPSQPSTVIPGQTWDGNPLIKDGPYNFVLTTQEKSFIPLIYPMIKTIEDSTGQTYFTINLTEQNRDPTRAAQFYESISAKIPRRNLDGTMEDCKSQVISAQASVTLGLAPGTKLYVCTPR